MLAVRRILAMLDVNQVGQIESLSFTMARTNSIVVSTVEQDKCGVLCNPLSPGLFRFSS